MDSMSAFMMGEIHKDEPLMVFDWDKAAQILKERGARDAGAGLAGDWEWTGGAILRDGQPVTDSYTYLASTWARPQLLIGEDEYDGEVIDCYCPMDGSEWDAGTKWPEAALAIFNG